ncbi:hypothetical protein Poli38472_005025 [Pythium oligandrum]|uniref:Uncharacterized protein n=1 Tax=Pythium oligandrum TaxID=41045 RepID=A0A8K1FEY5_PYTOL|nr:hypothetical protein Poli38472_005025 [Pythium oligandrum]|eukprot:TMW59956.1 hypothetical protein Poli38472_005025 [Pythium oligandrum]
MDARPSFFQVAALLDDVCTEHDRDAIASEHRIRDVKRFNTELDFLDERRGQGAALMTALHMIETLIVPICYREDIMNRYGDTCTARPVVIPLNLRRSNRQQLTATDVRDALNEWDPSLGDNFTGLPSEYTHVSDLGAHWESVKVVTARRSTQTTCEFCDSARHAIKEYRKEARAALRRFNEFLRDKRQEWRAEGLDSAEMHQRRSELKAEFFPEDSYPDINFADGQDDVILADICESSRFEMNPFSGMCSGFDRFDDDVYNALREEYMGLCETLCQPLCRTLNKSCFLIGRREEFLSGFLWPRGVQSNWSWKVT